MTRWRKLLLPYLAMAGVARADAPPVPIPGKQTICSSDRAICATIDRQRQTTTVRGKRGVLWTMTSAPPAAAVSGDGRSLVELYRPGGRLDSGDGPETVVAVIRDRGKIVRRVRLSDVILRPAKLPRSVSHRGWSRADYLAPDGAYVIDTEEGRRIRIALPAGTMTIDDLPDGKSATWFCRYAQPTTQGPCAAKTDPAARR